ncbi:hypothetical protein TorRG33x02_035940 [Trema orientale]|uniref:Uncharacterized protein n=1 Tax=Trema orientale TaxID=63057 RepID=A0A2P5FRW3_TREOI|nr:hypothetical protein TorRG33x02_035940 [Trema orientale]
MVEKQSNRVVPNCKFNFFFCHRKIIRQRYPTKHLIKHIKRKDNVLSSAYRPIKNPLAEDFLANKRTTNQFKTIKFNLSPRIPPHTIDLSSGSVVLHLITAKTLIPQPNDFVIISPRIIAKSNSPRPKAAAIAITEARFRKRSPFLEGRIAQNYGFIVR